MYVQLNLEDTPAFKALEKNKLKKKAQRGNAEPEDTIGADLVNPNRSPVLEALRLYPKRIALAAGAFISIQVTFYILIAFVIAYGTAEEGLNLPRSTMLSAVLIACVVQLFVQFPSASYSDRHGRRGIYLAGAGLLGIWGFAIFPLIDTGNFLLIVLALSGGLAFLAMQYGPQAAFYTELFSTKVRYSGASLGYQIGAILGGAFAPTLAVLLWKELGIVYVSVYIGIAALVTIASVLMLTETSGSNIHE
jgi:MFS family permease